VLDRGRSESGITILYGSPEQGYLVLVLYKHALLYIIITFHPQRNTYYDISRNMHRDPVNIDPVNTGHQPLDGTECYKQIESNLVDNRSESDPNETME